jgi:hypothetical protein
MTIYRQARSLPLKGKVNEVGGGRMKGIGVDRPIRVEKKNT